MSDKLLENIETLEGHLSGKAGEVDRPVELLAIAIRDAYSGGAECSTEADMRRARKDARTVLAELAKMVADALPSNGEVAIAWFGGAEASPAVRASAVTFEEPADRILALVRERIAPILAAKDAELARLREEIERLRAEAMPTDERLAEEAARFVYRIEWWDTATNEERMRVTDSALRIIRGDYDRTTFGMVVSLYAEGARRAGRRAAGAKGSA